MKFFNKKISPVYSLFILFFGFLFFYYGMSVRDSHAESKERLITTPVYTSPSVTRHRLSGFKYAHPLILVDIPGEAQDLQPLKNEISNYIAGLINTGEIESASVYVRIMNNGHYISINDQIGYNGGSLLKVPVMMTYLLEGEQNPASINRKFFVAHNDKVPNQTFNDGNIELGKNYPIKDLMYYMIAKSDNYATLALNSNINRAAYQNLFTVLDIPTPDLSDRNYKITCSDYSKFFRVLYNASYLNNHDADWSLELLTKTSFKDGLLSGLPDGIQVAHKFGEWGEPVAGSLHQLHESGIIYFEGNPVLVTIMTKGKEVKPLPGVISQITRIIANTIAPAVTAKR